MAGSPDPDIFERLRQLELPAGDFAIFGSGPLMVRGIIESTNDLDVLCRGPAWEQVQTIGRPEYLAEYGITTFAIDDGRITFGNRWAIGDFDTDTLIDHPVGRVLHSRGGAVRDVHSNGAVSRLWAHNLRGGQRGDVFCARVEVSSTTKVERNSFRSIGAACWFHIDSTFRAESERNEFRSTLLRHATSD